MKPCNASAPNLQKEVMDVKSDGGGGMLRPSRICFLTILSTTFWALIFYIHSSMQGNALMLKPSMFSFPFLSSIHLGENPPPLEERMLPEPTSPMTVHENQTNTYNDTKVLSYLTEADNKTSGHCSGRYIYVYDLPPRFNDDLVRDCNKLCPWIEMCKFVVNDGLGPAFGNEGGVFSDRGWYATDQFTLDMIFHSRMKQYECLTNDSSVAAAVYVPFYGGFDIGRYLWDYNVSMRDALSHDLVDWLMKRPEWRVMGGRDHFLVVGRTTWEFRRYGDVDEHWGNKLFTYPAIRNMTVLLIESSPWNGNDFAIPYPTYFHPVTDADVFSWQERMRKSERNWFFSFAGAPRPGLQTIRAQIIDQCSRSSMCKLFQCGHGRDSCNSPGSVMRIFESSVFCLQPRGDTYTRRSTFDTILAGCIPVFFHPGSAYVQYIWHLPKDYKKYSVLILHGDVTERNVSIEETLRKIPPEVVAQMREEVISLIPRLIYADPRSKLETLKDAFDVSVEAVISKVTKRRKAIAEGREYDDIIDGFDSWKYGLLEDGQKPVGPHEWDPLFG